MKKKTARDKKYLAFVLTQPCCICGIEDETIIYHHTTTGGTGMKGSDYLTIPLCGKHHAEVHNTGCKTFYDDHNKTESLLVLKTIRAYRDRGGVI